MGNVAFQLHTDDIGITQTIALTAFDYTSRTAYSLGSEKREYNLKHNRGTHVGNEDVTCAHGDTGSSMCIVVHGKQAFGIAVLEQLIERGEDVVAICCAPTKEGKPKDPLVQFAKDKGLPPVYQPASWKTAEALEFMKSFEADVCMMAYVLLFVPEAVLNAPRFGTFQYHPLLLPQSLHDHICQILMFIHLGCCCHYPFFNLVVLPGPIRHSR
jgi:hypothetical protein